jgi:hypothetical protein
MIILLLIAEWVVFIRILSWSDKSVNNCSEAVPQHTYEGAGRKGGTAPTH